MEGAGRTQDTAGHVKLGERWRLDSLSGSFFSSTSLADGSLLFSCIGLIPLLSLLLFPCSIISIEKLGFDLIDLVTEIYCIYLSLNSSSSSQTFSVSSSFSFSFFFSSMLLCRTGFTQQAWVVSTLHIPKKRLFSGLAGYWLLGE